MDHQRLPAGVRRHDAIAGRLADLFGARRLFLGALVVFIVGSLLAGAAPTLETLILARLVQAAGGGALIPVATSAASHLYDGPARPRALGVIGALTFLGMAAGPVLGAAILGSFHPDVALERLGVSGGSPLVDLFAPSWRWVFYVNVPVGIVALVLAWAASSGMGDAPARRPGGPGRGRHLLGVPGRHPGRPDAAGRRRRGTRGAGPGDRVPGAGRRGRGRRRRSRSSAASGSATRSSTRGCSGRASFSSAALVSLLTGYGFATAIVGGGGVRGPGAVRRPRRAAHRARGVGRRDRAGGARVGVRGAAAAPPAGHGGRARW